MKSFTAKNGWKARFAKGLLGGPDGYITLKPCSKGGMSVVAWSPSWFVAKRRATWGKI